MKERFNLPIILSIASVFIAALALCLSFIVYRQSRAVEFIWEGLALHYVKVSAQVKNDELPIDTCSLPIWLNFRITNTGLRTFSVDSILVQVNINDTTDAAGITKIYVSGPLLRSKSYSMKTVPTEEKIETPFVVEVGHSKDFLCKVYVPIPRKVCNRFVGKTFSLLDLSEDDLDMIRKNEFWARIFLTGGQTGLTRIHVGDMN